MLKTLIEYLSHDTIDKAGLFVSPATNQPLNLTILCDI